MPMRLPVAGIDWRPALDVDLIAGGQRRQSSRRVREQAHDADAVGGKHAAIVHLDIDPGGDRFGSVGRHIVGVVVERIDEVEEVDRSGQRELVIAVDVRGIELDVGPAPMRDVLALVGRVRQEVDGCEATLIELCVADIEVHSLLRQSVERAFVNAAPVRARAQDAARIVQLQIQHGRIGKPLRKHRPVRATVNRTPDADVGAGINMGRVR